MQNHQLVFACERHGGMDRRGGDRKSQTASGQSLERSRSRGSSSGTSVAAGDEESSWEADDLVVADYTPGRIDFNHDRYRRHCCLLDQHGIRMLRQLQHRFQFQDSDLLGSFLFFFLAQLGRAPSFLFSSQGAAAAYRQRLEAAPEPARTALEQGLSYGALPLADSSLRKRSKTAVRWFRRLYGAADIRPASAAGWLCLLAMFRYTGSIEFMEQTVFAESGLALPVRELLAAGLTPDSATAWGPALQRVVIAAAELRSSVAGWFESRDGRRRCFRAKDALQHGPWNYRPLDHLLAALPLWVNAALNAALAFMDLLSAVRQGVPQTEQEGQCESFMRSLSEFPLLGRKGVRAAKPEEFMFAYGAKFLLADAFQLLQCAVCAGGETRGLEDTQVLKAAAARCQCSRCLAVYALRLKYSFFGPAAPALHCALLRRSPSDTAARQETVSVWRALAQFLNAEASVKLCLYFYQMLPCSWRRFSTQCARAENGAPLQWSTPYRELARRVVCLEHERLLYFSTMLGQLSADLQTAFEQLPLERRRQIFMRPDLLRLTLPALAVVITEGRR